MFGQKGLLQHVEVTRKFSFFLTIFFFVAEVGQAATGNPFTILATSGPAVPSTSLLYAALNDIIHFVSQPIFYNLFLNDIIHFLSPGTAPALCQRKW